MKISKDVSSDQEIIYSFCETEEEKSSNYQIVLGGAETLFPALSRSIIVRNLFFKKLCKEIEVFKIKESLSYPSSRRKKNPAKEMDTSLDL